MIVARWRSTHKWPARRSHRRKLWQVGGGSRRASGTVTCAARRNRDAPDAAHTGGIPGAPLAASRGRRGVVTARERHGDVRGSLRSRRAGCGAYRWHALRTSCRRPAVPGGRRGRRAHDKAACVQCQPAGGGSPGLGGRSRALGVSASRRNSRARTQSASRGGSPALRQILCWRHAHYKLKQSVFNASPQRGRGIDPGLGGRGLALVCRRQG